MLAELLARTALPDVDGCRLWLGGTQSRGYPSVANGKGSSVLGHRLAWELHNGRRIRRGYTVDHNCHKKLCMTPEHLEEISRKVNSGRGNGSTPLYCVRSHPLFANLGHWKRRADGRRTCLVCKALQEQKRRRRA
jgi:hypothetical protein